MCESLDAVMALLLFTMKRFSRKSINFRSFNGCLPASGSRVGDTVF